MSEPSCLPPPGTASGTTHVLRGPDGTMAALFWSGMSWWLGAERAFSPNGTALCGWVCVAPLTLPAEVERLRAEVTRLRKALETLASLQHERDACAPSMADYARAALEPPHAE